MFRCRSLQMGWRLSSILTWGISDMSDDRLKVASSPYIILDMAAARFITFNTGMVASAFKPFIWSISASYNVEHFVCVTSFLAVTVAAWTLQSAYLQLSSRQIGCGWGWTTGIHFALYSAMVLAPRFAALLVNISNETKALQVSGGNICLVNVSWHYAGLELLVTAANHLVPLPKKKMPRRKSNPSAVKYLQRLSLASLCLRLLPVEALEYAIAFWIS